jgi:hypothetical protein
MQPYKGYPKKKGSSSIYGLTLEIVSFLQFFFKLKFLKFAFVRENKEYLEAIRAGTVTEDHHLLWSRTQCIECEK